MNKKFRSGNIGALMDEYEKASDELIILLSTFSQSQFHQILDSTTSDPDCHSIKTIINHVVDAGYRYANQIRKFLKVEEQVQTFEVESVEQAIAEIKKMLGFTVESINGNWLIPYKDIVKMRMETHWGLYDIEMMLEHAIVHILRHRRQIEKLKQNSI